jgi:predicted outer membrane protein
MNSLRTAIVSVCLAAQSASAADAPKKPEPPFLTQPQPAGAAKSNEAPPSQPPTRPAIEPAKPKAPAVPDAAAAQAKPSEVAEPADAPKKAPAGDAAASDSRPEPKAAARNAAPEAPKPSLISTEIGGRDLQFLQSAAEVGRLQAWLGEQAENKAETDQVKAVGDALHETHADEIRMLTHLAASKGVALGAGGGIPARQRQLSGEIAKLNGPKFEKTVMEQIVAVSQELASIYEAGTRSRDPEIKSFAERMLPLAKDKLQLASRMSGRAARTDAAPGFRSSDPAPASR